MSKNTLDLETFLDLIERSIPEFNSDQIDEFIARGNKVEECTLYTGMDGLPSLLRTKHGILRIRYNPFLESNQALITNTL